jgi:hypothetical protein
VGERSLCLSVFAGVACAALLAARPARAEIKIAERNGWVLTTEGRLNSFLSVARGDAIPMNEQNYTGLDDEATPDHTLESARVRTGFIASVLGFDLKSQLSETVSVHGRASLWMLASSQRSEGDEPAVDAREAFFKLEGPFGGFLAGRAMGLFSRGAILGNYELEHAYGLGHPCATKVASVGACGHAGFGVLFPGFHAGLVYNTPVIGGFQLSAGVFDPAALNEGAYRRTPLPRAEAEATLNVARHFRAFAGVLWQPVSRNDTVTDPVTMMNVTQEQNVTATGISYGALVAVGPLAVGGSGYYGKGLGLNTPLEDNPINIISATGELRTQDGYYGAATLTIAETKLAGGVGISRLKRDAADPPDTGNVITPKQQVGFSGGVYQGVSKTVFLALEVFRGITTWFDRGEPMGADLVVVRPRQAVTFVNAGATMVW